MSSKHCTLILAVAYLRCSTDRQDTSIAQQKELLEQFAAKNGYRIVRWFIDEGISGTTDRRPAYQQLLEAARAGNLKGKTLLVASRDRLSRQDTIDYFADIRDLRDGGVQLLSLVEGPVDWHEDYGWLLDGITQTKTSGESISISHRALRGMAASAKAGRFQGGKPPQGYRVRREPHPTEAHRLVAFLEHDPEQAEIIRHIFRRFIEGASIRSLVAELPGEWTWNKVRGILSNPRYVRPATWYASTVSKFHRLEGGSPRRERRKRGLRVNGREAWVIGQQTCEPIIDQATWDRAQGRLKNLKGWGRGRRQAYALSGLCVCGNCQSRLAGTFNNRNETKYLMCNRIHFGGRGSCPGGSIPESYLVDGLAEVLQEVLFAEENRAAIRRYVKDYADSQPQAERQRAKRLELEMEQLDRRHQELHGLLAVGGEDAAVLITAMRQNRAKFAAVERERAEVTEEPSIDVGALENEFWAICECLQEVFTSQDAERIRGALANIIDRIEVTWSSHEPRRKLIKDAPSRRTTKRVETVKVVLRDDPLLRVLLLAGTCTACRAHGRQQVQWTLKIAGAA